MTLLFAGHDTTTATIAFLFYELARHPEVADAIAAEPGGPLLDQALDETLRLYPPAWIGPRRAARDFEFGGHRIAEGAPVNYSSWASHRLPDVWEAPHEFRPERFAPEARKRIPKGAYVPFGGGSRICLGMRFGQLEIKAIAGAISERFRVELQPGFELRIRQTPTLGPAERSGDEASGRGRGLPVRIRVAREPRED
jgi:cytochrome P450